MAATILTNAIMSAWQTWFDQEYKGKSSDYAQAEFNKAVKKYLAKRKQLLGESQPKIEKPKDLEWMDDFRGKTDKPILQNVLVENGTAIAADGFCMAIAPTTLPDGVYDANWQPVIGASFPDWKTIPPDTSKATTMIKVNTADLWSAFVRADVFARDANNTICITFERDPEARDSEQYITISAESCESGSIKTIVSATCAGDSLVFHLKAENMLKSLAGWSKVISKKSGEFVTHKTCKPADGHHTTTIYATRPDRPVTIESGDLVVVAMTMHVGVNPGRWPEIQTNDAYLNAPADLTLPALPALTPSTIAEIAYQKKAADWRQHCHIVRAKAYFDNAHTTRIPEPVYITTDLGYRMQVTIQLPGPKPEQPEVKEETNTMVTFETYQGQPMITLQNGKVKFSFMLRKAELILENIEEIRNWYEKEKDSKKKAIEPKTAAAQPIAKPTAAVQTAKPKPSYTPKAVSDYLATREAPKDSTPRIPHQLTMYTKDNKAYAWAYWTWVSGGMTTDRPEVPKSVKIAAAKRIRDICTEAGSKLAINTENNGAADKVAPKVVPQTAPKASKTPIKTLKFDDETLDVLRDVEWSDDGKSAVITQQLDRKLYEKVNKALEAMGGKWNRKAKAHLFSTDPRESVEGLIESGQITVEKDGFFETPPDLAARMVQRAHLRTGDRVLEPSAGLGAIARAIADVGAVPVCVERNGQRADVLDESFWVTCADFMEYTPSDEPFDAVVMNPPFENGQDMDHVQRAYGMLKDGGRLVAIMSEGPFFRTDRKASAFRSWLEAVNGISEKLPEGTFRVSGTGVNTRMVVIDKPSTQKEIDAVQTLAEMKKASWKGCTQPKTDGSVIKWSSAQLAKYEEAGRTIDKALGR